MSPPTIRLACNEDGPAIGLLHKIAELPDYGVNWATAQVHGWWLVAETNDGEIVGAIQIMAAQPFGYIGALIVHPAYQATGRGTNGDALTGRLGQVAYDLLITAFVVLRNSGVQLVLGTVSTDTDALRHVYERHGGLNLGLCTLMGRRLS